MAPKSKGKLPQMAADSVDQFIDQLEGKSGRKKRGAVRDSLEPRAKTPKVQSTLPITVHSAASSHTPADPPQVVATPDGEVYPGAASAGHDADGVGSDRQHPAFDLESELEQLLDQSVTAQAICLRVPIFESVLSITRSIHGQLRQRFHSEIGVTTSHSSVVEHGVSVSLASQSSCQCRSSCCRAGTDRCGR